MAYNTNNPLGSSDPRDLFDNSSIFDKYMTGSDEIVYDRFGQPRWAPQAFHNLVINAKAQIDPTVAAAKAAVNAARDAGIEDIGESVAAVDAAEAAAKAEMEATAAALGDDLNNKHASTYAQLVAMPQARDAVIGFVDADPDPALNGWYYWNASTSAWVRAEGQPANSQEVRFGLVPVLSYDAKNATYFNDVSGFVRTVVDGRIQFAPNGSTTSVGYFARNLLSAERIDPGVNGRLRYRIRRTAGNLSRLYVVQIRDSTGAYWSYFPYSATPNNLVDDGGWVTYEVDISRKPDGTAWAAGVLIDQIFVSLSLGNGNSTWQLDWLAVGAARSDAVYNADLKRQVAISSAARAVLDTNSAKRTSYGFIPAVEANGDTPSFWASLSGFTRAIVNGLTVFTPNGTTTTGGFAARSLSASEKFDPAVNSSLKYRIKKTAGTAQRSYLIFLRDSNGVGHYYQASVSAKYSLVDRTDWVTYEVNIGVKPDGSPWSGELIEQIWLSLTAGTDGITWTLDWLVVGKPTSNAAANSDILRLTDRVDSIPTQGGVTANALTRMKSALYNPLHSTTIHLVGDSITWGVGATGSTTGAVNNGNLADGRNILTNNTWANLLHRWLGESFADGILVPEEGVATYQLVNFIPVDNPFNPGYGSFFHIVNGGEKVVPLHKFNASAYTAYYYPFDKTQSGANGNYNQPLTFDLVGDNLSVMYCSMNTGDPDGSIVELYGNGALLGSFSYYGPESFSKLAELTFPFGKYKMSLVNKSVINQFRLEGFKFKKTVKVINDGLSGTSTGTWLPGSANLNGVIAKQSEFMLVQLGTNDRTNKASFVTYFNLARIAKALIAAGKDVTLMAANAVAASSEAPNGGRGFGQRDVAEVTKQLAEELGLAFIDNHQATVMAKVKGETWTADGLHPNDYGYGLMFDNIRSKILGQ